MIPMFKITADDNDITAKISDRLVRLTIVDEAGFKSDTLTLKIDNRDYAVEVPSKGAKLEVSLGYDSELTLIGRYIVDEVGSGGGGATSLTIKAKAADMLGGLKARKTRAWGEDTIGDIVSAIAAEHDLQPRINAGLAAIVAAPIPYAQIDQTNENDLHFLTRLARKYDAVCKPVLGYLIFVPRGEAKAASGQTLDAVILSEADATTWNVRAPERGKYQTVKAYWVNPQTQEREHVTVGEGSPVHTLSHSYGSADEAESAAGSKLAALQRGASIMSLSLPGDANLFAEAKLTFNTRDTLANGPWSITRAEHELTGGTGGGFSTRLDLETPKEKK